MSEKKYKRNWDILQWRYWWSNSCHFITNFPMGKITRLFWRSAFFC